MFVCDFLFLILFVISDFDWSELRKRLEIWVFFFFLLWTGGGWWWWRWVKIVAVAVDVAMAVVGVVNFFWK